jgi:hypothetical protein
VEACVLAVDGVPFVLTAVAAKDGTSTARVRARSNCAFSWGRKAWWLRLPGFGRGRQAVGVSKLADGACPS